MVLSVNILSFGLMSLQLFFTLFKFAYFRLNLIIIRITLLISYKLKRRNGANEEGEGYN